MKCEQPVVQELNQRHVAYVSFTGNYIGNQQVFADLFHKLGDWAGQNDLIGKDTIFISAYYDDPRVTPPDELKLDVCMSVPEDSAVAGEIQKQVLPGGKYIVMHSELSAAEYGPAWEFVVKWLESNEYEIDVSRPAYEIYLNDPEQHPQKHHIVDICMSVK